MVEFLSTDLTREESAPQSYLKSPEQKCLGRERTAATDTSAEKLKQHSSLCQIPVGIC